MRPAVRRTVSHKLVSVTLLTTLVALVLAISALGAYTLRAEHRQLVSDLRVQSELLGRMTAPALAFHDRALARNNLALLHLRPQVVAATLYDAEGRVFATYAAEDRPVPDPLPVAADGLRFDGHAMDFTLPIVQDKDMLGTLHIRVDTELLPRLFGLLGVGVLVTALAMLIAYLLVNRLHHAVTAPILAIADIARGVVERRDYAQRAPKASDDEIGLLADSFNDMLSEIGKRTQALERSNEAIAREARERGEAQQEVMRLNTELEQRVRDRTAQLEVINDQLGQAKAAADRANAAKSDFLSSMSHELRTPLNAILGFAQLLDSDTLPISPGKRHDYVAHILKAGRHLLVLINEVLDLAKIESGSVALSMEPVGLADVFRECRQMIEPAAAPRHIRLAFVPPGRQHVVADRTRLKQVLLNLLSNAVKYNRDGGQVTVRADAVPGGRVRVTVQDTGQGLDAVQRAMLFQPFNRLGQESGPEEGTGIGLVVTRRLVELMGGRIGLESTVDVGSAFWFELDACAEAVRAAPLVDDALPAGAAASPAVHRRTVLYVEDNPANLRLVEEIVALRPDLQLLSAADGALGVTLAQAHRPDVVLMDLNLPGIGGAEALALLRRDPRTARIPVIALTANAMPRDVEAGLAAGFFRYLTKPLDISALLAALDAALALPGPPADGA